ncbi:MAG: DUF58 domain-containing protein [Nitrososphaerota archaeon]|nr:DUF58 domain-containing protein [Nitrososphaerota archaeon]
MLTRKTSTVVILSMTSVFVGLLLRNSYIILISVPLISYLALSFLLYSSQVHTNLAVRRFVNRESMYEDGTADVRLEIQNIGTIKLEFVQIIDTLPRELKLISGSNRRILNLNPRETFSFIYSIAPKTYGYYEMGPAEVVVKDNQSLLTSTKIFSAKTLLKVRPKIQYVPKIAIRPKRTRNWPGEIVARKTGGGLEFYSLREYLHGDPVKRINWKKSSLQSMERDRLFTNQYMSELGGDTIIALDVRTISALGEPPDSTDNYSTRAAAIVAHRLLRDRNRVGMIILGTTLDKVPPGFGKRQFDRILAALSQVKPDSTWEIGNLGGYLSFFFSTMVQIILISPLMDDNSFHAVIDIAARGYQILVISPSPIEIEKRLFSRKYAENEFIDLAERLLRVRRENRLNVLRRSAVVVDWNVDAPLSEALREATYLWNKRRMSTATIPRL